MSMIEEIEEFAAAHPEITRVEVLLPDINGILRGKQYPFAGLKGATKKGFNFPLSTVLLDAQGGVPADVISKRHDGDPDRFFFPVEGSLRRVPWSDPELAQVLVTCGGPEVWDPRSVMEGVLSRLKENGQHPVIAIELEFYLLNIRDGHVAAANPMNGFPRLRGPQCYSVDVLYDYEPFIKDVEQACQVQQIPVTSILCEYGDGQFEANLQHSGDPLRACDEAICLKRAIKAVARNHGFIACFMAKPLGQQTGNGLHVHVSINDNAGANLFAGDGGRSRLENAVGGTLKSMAESMALFAPNANSYRRFQRGYFVPTTTSWGENHRDVAVRIPLSDDNNKRLEHRISGADACPYLVTAAVLAGAHYGLENDVKPPPGVDEGSPVGKYSSIPTRWSEALDAFADAAILKPYLGKEFCQIYLRTKRNEEERYSAEIPDLDHNWYLRSV